MTDIQLSRLKRIPDDPWLAACRREASVETSTVCETLGMTRKCTTVDDEATRNLTVRLREALPPHHLARFVAEVIAQRDLRRLSVR